MVPPATVMKAEKAYIGWCWSECCTLPGIQILAVFKGLSDDYCENHNSAFPDFLQLKSQPGWCISIGFAFNLLFSLEWMCTWIVFEHFIAFNIIYSFVREKSGERTFTTLAPFFSLSGGLEERGREEKNKSFSASSAINCIFSSKRHLLTNVNVHHCFYVNICTDWPIHTGMGLLWIFNPYTVELNIIYHTMTLECQKHLTRSLVAPSSVSLGHDVKVQNSCLQSFWLCDLKSSNLWMFGSVSAL